MAGNILQWTADVYRADTHSLNLQSGKSQGDCCLNPKGPAESFDPPRPVPRSMERVVKGGSFCAMRAIAKVTGPLREEACLRIPALGMLGSVA